MTKTTTTRIVIAIAICLTANLRASAQFSGGSGTSNDPFVITTAAQLATLATLVNTADNIYYDKYYILQSDINLSAYGANWNGGKGWISIGIYNYSNNGFSGVFDGNYKTITGLYINDPIGYETGLFAYIKNNGVVKNLGLENVNITGDEFVGSIAGNIYYGSIIRCYATGNIKAHEWVGGLVGSVTSSEILNSYSACNVTATGWERTGGIAGILGNATVTGCYSTGNISGGEDAGGITGWAYNSTISYCAALNQKISVRHSEPLLGRIVGFNLNSILAGNIAYAGMLNTEGNSVWGNTGLDHKDGLSVSKSEINADGTLGGRFTPPVWTTQNGKLPGLFGKVADMPMYLAFPAFSGGDGSESNPYLITTAYQLAVLAINVNDVNNAYYDKHYKLENNIFLHDYGSGYNSGKGWFPIGKHNTEDTNYGFHGVFDGNFKKIMGLYINNNTNDCCLGLFGVTRNNAVIKNLGVEFVNINAQQATAVGAVVGNPQNTTITACYSTGIIRGRESVGGIVGNAYDNINISDCYSSCEIIGSGGRIGGVAGWIYDDSNLSNCYSTANVIGNNNVGGIAGQILNSTLSNCAALNPRVSGNEATTGRVVGNNVSSDINSNIGYMEMLNINGTTYWMNTGLEDRDGLDISKQEVNDNGTLGERFMPPVWTTQNGRLPGLFGATADIPPHLLILSFPDGDGSESNPYVINTAAQFAALATAVNSGNTDFNSKNYKLGNDIDLSEYGEQYNGGKGWIPVGYYFWPNNHRFFGNFDGDGRVISGLYINDDDRNNIGLFGTVTGNIKNVAIENVNITGYYTVGAVVGFSSGNVSNCYSTGSVKGDQYVGGIIGTISEGEVSNCYSTCEVSGEFSVGGIAGELYDYGSLYNSAALNPSVKATDYDAGRVAGNVGMSPIGNNIAFVGMLNNAGHTSWDNVGSHASDGEDISKESISADGTLGNRFTSPVWITQNGKLPGFRKTNDLPQHLHLDGMVYITTVVLKRGYIGEEYTELLTAEGSTPITWTLETGSLPSGVTLAANGTISGTPTTEGAFTFTVKATNSIGSDIKGLEIIIGAVDIDQLRIKNYELRVFPNPTTGHLTISPAGGGQGVDDLGIENVEIYDMTGRCVGANLCVRPDGTIDISHLPNGLYILKIGNQTIKITKK